MAVAASVKTAATAVAETGEASGIWASIRCVIDGPCYLLIQRTRKIIKLTYSGDGFAALATDASAPEGLR